MAPLNFDALRDLHNCANDLLHSPKIKQALVRHHQDQKWVNEVSEASLRMLDVCGISRDVLLLMKEHLHDLQFTLRRVTTDKPAVYHNLTVVVDVLREVRATTIAVVESLLSLISIPWLDQKSNKGCLKSMLKLSRGQSLYDICDVLALQSANKRLEAVEIAVEDLEAELDCMSRRLIQTRVLLLNILTN